MKAAKIILVILLILFIGACGYVAVQPNSYDVSRTKTINAPKALVFEQVEDLKNWEAWSPWKEKDETLTFNYPEKTKGEGGHYSWEGKDGKGEMKILTVVPNDSIHQELKFENFPTSDVYWKFNDAENGTDVTWGMKSDNTSFMMKFFALLYGGMDNMIGPDYERGLEKLDSLVVESMKKFEITIEGEKEYGGGFYLYTTTNANSENISTTMGQQYVKIGVFMGKNNIAMNGMPLTVYHDMNMKDGTVIMSNGIPVSEKINISDSDVQCGYIPKTKVIKTVLKGNYDNLSQAWGQTMQYLAENNIVQSDLKPFEIYTNDPGNFPNPADWVTEIYIPIKE